MTHFLWTPGDCLAAVTPRGVLVTEAGHEDLCHTFWEALTSGADLGTLLQTLTSAFSANLAALPGFAAIIHEGDETHLAIRGAFEVHITQPQGTISMSSGRVITWEEKRLHDVSAWTISSPGNDEACTPARAITSGVVPVRTLGTDMWMSLMYEPTQVNEQSLPSAPEQVSAPTLTPEDEADIHRTRAYPDLDEYLEISDESLSQDEPTGNDEGPTGTGETEDNQTPADVESSADEAQTDTPLVTTIEELFADHAPASPSVEAAAVRNARDDDPLTTLPEEHSEEELAREEDQEATLAQDGTGRDEATDASKGFFISEVPHHPTPTVPQGEEGQHPAHIGGFFIDGIPETDQAGESAHETESQGDHDGHTIRSNRHDILRQQAQEAIEATTTINTLPTVNMIFALLCINGHPNPTHVNSCLTCDATLGTSTTQVPQPTLGILRFSTGEVLPLDRDVIVGRRPAYRPQPGRPEAHVVPVPSPNQEISRTHCEVSINGWDVRVRDLGSNNGTFLHRPGQAPVRITDSSPSILRPGDILDLGDGVTIIMEAL